MANPHFRRNLILVAVFHILIIAAIVYIARREFKKPQEQISWIDPGAFIAEHAET